MSLSTCCHSATAGLPVRVSRGPCVCFSGVYAEEWNCWSQGMRMGLISAVTVPRATSPAGSVAVLTLGLANTRDCPDVFIFAWGMGVKCFVTVLLIYISLRSRVVEIPSYVYWPCGLTLL